MSRLAKKNILLRDDLGFTKENNKIFLFKKNNETCRENFIVMPSSDTLKVDYENNYFQIKFHKNESANAGLVYSLLKNVVQGLTEGFTKNLILSGLGYKVSLIEKKLVLSIGYSHTVKVDIPNNIDVSVNKDVELIIKSSNKESLGQFCSHLVNLKRKDVYHGKGIRYVGAPVLLKAGKKK